MKTTLVIAHRGDSSIALENSIESIRSALFLSVDMVEIDIRLNCDRELYVMHDNTTGRTAKKNIDIEESTKEKISRIRLKNGESIPMLAAVLNLLSGTCGLNLEIKSKGAGAVTAEYLISSHYTGDILLSSFKEEEVLAARRVMPTVKTSLIFDDFMTREVPAYKAKGYDVISLSKKTVNEKLINTCHEQGIRVYVWTVDNEVEMRTLMMWGVDGIYSNRPGALKEIVHSTELRLWNKTI